MIILKPIATAQTLKFIAREDVCDSIVLRDEQDNTEVTINATFSLSSYYLTADIIFSLQEDRFYNLTAYNGSTIVYKDKIFCTSQEIDDYSINNGDYKEHSSNNDYITL
jgi:hypothetical protein